MQAMCNQVDTGQPGASEHAKKERILRAAIKARDRMGGVKTHYETLMSRLGDETAKGSCHAALCSHSQTLYAANEIL